MKINLFIFCLALICCTDCVAQLRAQAPTETEETIFPVTEKRLSRICVPIRFPIPYLQTFEKNICEYYGGHYDDSNIKLDFPIPLVYTVDVDYKIWRDAQFDEFRLSGDTFSMQEKLYYSADGFASVNVIPLSGQCGWDDEAAREVIIGFDSKISFSENYSLFTKTKRRPVITPNRCLVTIANRDVTSNLVNLIESFMDFGANKVDEIVPNLTNFKIPTEKLWTDLQKPVKVGEGSWLTLGLKKLSGGQIVVSDGSPQIVATTIGFEFEPEIRQGGMPTPTNIPFPKLSLENCSPIFEVNPEFSFSLRDLDVRLNKELSNGAINYTYGRRKLILNSLESYSSGQELILQVNAKLRPVRSKTIRFKVFRELVYWAEKLFYRKNGSLYFRGTLGMDSTTTIFSIKNLSFDKETKYQIDRKSPWIANTDILQTLSAKSTYSIDDKVESFAKALNDGFNRQVDKIQLKVTDIKNKLNAIFIYHDKIYIRLNLACGMNAIYMVEKI